MAKYLHPDVRVMLVRSQHAVTAPMCMQVSAAVRAVYPSANVVLFGSQPAGLALPDSDLDLVVLDAVAGLESRCDVGLFVRVMCAD
jgi:DNA polymerase sigma